MKAIRLITLWFCLIGYSGTLSAQSLYQLHWSDSGDPNFGGSGGSALTQLLDTACSQLSVSVTDPVNAPLGSSSPLILNPMMQGGGDLVDLSNNMNFFLRVKSREAVSLGFLLRSGDGSSAFRTDRLEVVVPGDTINWTEVSFQFDSVQLAGFDSTDLRDVWFYLDRGTSNFAGNDFQFDFFSIGENLDTSTYSICPPDTGSTNPGNSFYQIHWTSSEDQIFGGSGGVALTQELDSACSMLILSVTDTANSPLGAFSPLSINPRLPDGSELTDLSGELSFHARVRSLEEVSFGLILRSVDGSSTFRTNLQEFIIPADTTSWTEIDYKFDAAQLAGFDSTDLRDVWLFLDRGTANFAGNEFIIDYLAFGMAPDSMGNSTCPLDTTSDPGPQASLSYAIHYDNNDDPLFTGSSAAAIDQIIDSACSQLFISVADTANNPWNGTSPIILNPKDAMGADITDLSNSMSFHLRARSKETVEVALLLRSGDGSSAFRTSRISQSLVGDTLQWTELTFNFDSVELAGFDSTDLRDVWLYLDYGTNNFSGNAFWLDYIAIGDLPAAETHSSCSLVPPFDFPWVLHWADTLDPLTSGSGAEFLTQTVDTSCSQIGITVTDPVMNPHPAFRPIILNPVDQFGLDIEDLSGQLRFYARIRSIAQVDFSLVVRGGEGTSGERTEIMTQTIPAGLSTWTDVVFDLSGTNLGNFDSTSLRDLFLYFDRDQPNFAGNEVYIDYVSLGSSPAASGNSTCGENSLESNTQTSLKVYPSPVQRGQELQLELSNLEGKAASLSLLDMNGRLLESRNIRIQDNKASVKMKMDKSSKGLYVLKVEVGDMVLYQKVQVN
ncbi:MAG: T9SS type A sorting domain-containing protein [Bacteroidia bacterium]|nr:T9SS type A sorting domain-containing protein [Bacteroidia bacterium]